ncbi:hypothetical protein FIBSPDRAFT_894437 [Athelia psychrophila]|uniref:Uncharacterized protein n=1 Tax=Athelia psychrophila TaxID=1759441 RepID=A0A166FUJ2_9AGAM|nr:hypothetical protein FIBSPDRAFT_894437 [Fibularhizoctonia sp. CBS 109695]
MSEISADPRGATVRLGVPHAKTPNASVWIRTCWRRSGGLGGASAQFQSSLLPRPLVEIGVGKGPQYYRFLIWRPIWRVPDSQICSQREVVAGTGDDVDAT